MHDVLIIVVFVGWTFSQDEGQIVKEIRRSGERIRKGRYP